MRRLVFAVSARRTTPLLTVVLAAVACGGPAAPPKDSSASADAGAKPSDDDSIGDLAAAQGGLAGLGGDGNREGGATGTEVAMVGPLRAEEVDKNNPVKMDGDIKEWPPRSKADTAVSGKTDAKLAASIQYDDAKIYVAAEIADASLKRSAGHKEGDDHVTFVLAFPSGRGALKAYEIGLWPGNPGSSPGVVKWTSGPSKGQEVTGSKIVEDDVKGGTGFEAWIPWSAFAEGRTMRVGLRAALRYHDGDGSSTAGVVATGPGGVDKPADLPALPTEPEQAIVDQLLEQKGLSGTKPKIDVFADVAGDDRKERVSVFGKFFTVCGPGYRGGHQFFWREVQGQLAALETRDVTGHGKDDFVVRRRLAAGDALHEILEVWSITGGDEPVTLFSQEIAVVSKDGKKKLSNAVRVSPKEIEVSVEKAEGWDASTFKEQGYGDEPILLPWGAVKSRTFKMDGKKFAKANEVAQTPSAGVASNAGAGAEALPRDVPTPPVKNGSDLGKAVLDAYYKDSGAPQTKPRFDLEVNVDGDGRPERVLLAGRDIVVLGPGFKGGSGYARMSLTQFADDKDVSEMTARDVTGDGAAEIVVRGVRHVSTPDGQHVSVDGLFVYTVKGGNLARVFSIETGREEGKNRVQGLVQFVPAKGGKGFDIDARPGVAKGWTEKTYPWPQDKPGGAIEPLLLPWGKIPSLRYTWNGTEFTSK